jgi:hypothetical protein
MSAWAIDPLDIGLGTRLPLCLALLEKAYALNPDFNVSALDEVFFLIYASLPEGMGGDKQKAAMYWKQAETKQNGRSAGIYVSWAEAIDEPSQNYQEFKDMLGKALAVDIEADKANRLVNVINQRKAQWLLDHAYYYFIDAETGDEDEEWTDEDS